MFHDREERVAATVLNDTQALTTAGYAVSWLRQLPLIYTAEVALDQAEAFVARMPTDKLGLLFLEAGEVVQSDPDRADAYQTHAGQRRGQWPSSPEISAAMFARYDNKPSP